MKFLLQSLQSVCVADAHSPYIFRFFKTFLSGRSYSNSLSHYKGVSTVCAVVTICSIDQFLCSQLPECRLNSTLYIWDYLKPSPPSLPSWVMTWIVCGYRSSRKSADKGVQSRCVGTLLKLLSHPLMEVRQHTYHTLLTTIQVRLYTYHSPHNHTDEITHLPHSSQHHSLDNTPTTLLTTIHTGKTTHLPHSPHNHHR